jgi:hypothetical protein
VPWYALFMLLTFAQCFTSAMSCRTRGSMSAYALRRAVLWRGSSLLIVTSTLVPDEQTLNLRTGIRALSNAVTSCIYKSKLCCSFAMDCQHIVTMDPWRIVNTLLASVFNVRRFSCIVGIVGIAVWGSLTTPKLRGLSDVESKFPSRPPRCKRVPAKASLNHPSKESKRDSDNGHNARSAPPPPIREFAPPGARSGGAPQITIRQNNCLGTICKVCCSLADNCTAWTNWRNIICSVLNTTDYAMRC